MATKVKVREFVVAYVNIAAPFQRRIIEGLICQGQVNVTSTWVESH